MIVNILKKTRHRFRKNVFKTKELTYKFIYCNTIFIMFSKQKISISFLASRYALTMLIYFKGI